MEALAIQILIYNYKAMIILLKIPGYYYYHIKTDNNNKNLINAKL